MHLQGGIRLPVVAGVAFDVKAGECAVLAGPSGAGKSSILKMIFGNYRCDAGSIVVRHRRRRWSTSPLPSRGRFWSVRRTTSAMSASFCAPCRAWRRSTSSPSRWSIAGVARTEARAEGGRPAVVGSTSRSGFGRCRRRRSRAGSSSASISRGASCPDLPILLLDEPTASLDAGNRAVVVDLVAEKKRSGDGRGRDRARRRRAYGDCRHRR